MATQFPPRPSSPTGVPRQGATFWLWLLVAIALGVAVAVVGLPTLLPALTGSVTGPAPHGYWYISRASAFVAYVLLWMSMLAGLGITSMLARVWPGMLGSYELHRYTGLLGLLFACVHAFILLGDQYIGYTLSQVLVPFLGGSYRPEWVGFGQVALYLLAIVAITSYLRDRIGIYTWRLIHMLSFALFLMALVHGLQSGTDSHDWWARSLYVVSAATVLFGTVYRVLVTRTGQPKQTLATSDRVIVAGKAQTPPKHPSSQGPGRSSR
jgi:predicted ferric reductase